MKLHGYIYKTTNLLNNKAYIGQHRGEFNPNYYGSGIIIRRAIEKDGKQNFKIEVLAWSLSDEQQNILEKKFIADCRNILGKENVYNISEGGDGKFWEVPPMLGKHHSKESIEKIRQSNTGLKRTKETCERIGRAQLGRGKSEGEKEKRRNTLKANGYKCSEETKERIRQTKIGDKNPAKRLDVRKKLSLSHIGYIMPEEQKRKIAISMKKTLDMKRRGLNARLQ